MDIITDTAVVKFFYDQREETLLTKSYEIGNTGTRAKNTCHDHKIVSELQEFDSY